MDDLPNLEENDYLEKNANFWKEYRVKLYKLASSEKEKIEKTPENIINMAKEIGIKPTARYFEIQPSQVRYFIKKYSK